MTTVTRSTIYVFAHALASRVGRDLVALYHAGGVVAAALAVELKKPYAALC